MVTIYGLLKKISSKSKKSHQITKNLIKLQKISSNYKKSHKIKI